MKAVYLFSSDLASLRLVTIMWGVLSIVSFYFLGNRFGNDVGWIAFAIMLFHPWVQHHTVHIRFYELWSFTAIIGLFYTHVLVKRIASGACRLLDCCAFPVLLLLPCTVHAFGVVNALCLSAYFALSVWRSSEIKFQSFVRREWIIGLAVFLIMGIIVAGNIAVFGYATLIDGQAEDWINSTSMVQIWASFVFNAGYLSPLIVIASMTLILFRRKLDEYRHFLDLFIAVAFSLIPALVITAIKPHAFRSDYLYGVLPYVLLVVAFSVDTLGRMIFQEREALATKMFLVVIIIGSTLPTFVSNVFIDKDRLPHDVAAAMISSLGEIKAYAPNPNYFNYYLMDHEVRDIHLAAKHSSETRTDEYFFIPMRKGMSTQFFYDFNSLDGLKLIKILGKDRLDLRSNQIYVFLRKGDLRR